MNSTRVRVDGRDVLLVDDGPKVFSQGQYTFRTRSGHLLVSAMDIRCLSELETAVKLHSINQDPVVEVWMSSTDYAAFMANWTQHTIKFLGLTTDPTPACECGAVKCGMNIHSSWCPLFVDKGGSP